jgi:hypothetical protein
MQVSQEKHTKLSIVVPCFNEEKTLERCLQHVLEIQDEQMWSWDRGSQAVAPIGFYILMPVKRRLRFNF